MFTWLQKLKEQWREANQKARQEMTAKTLETMEPHVLDAVEKDKGRFIIEIPRRLKNPDEVKEVVVAHFRPIVEAKGYEILITPHDQNWCVTFSHPEKSVQERQELIVDLIRGIKKHIENKETRFGLELALFFLILLAKSA